MTSRFFADLHIHSRYSRATSSDLTIPSILKWSQLKGISLVATGDFTHPDWMKEICATLEEDGNGLLVAKTSVADGARVDVPMQARRDVRFILSVEISSIYKKAGRVRKVHSLVFMPTIAAAERFSLALGRLGNIKSDGRPILGLDPLLILRLAKETDQRAFMIPAHVWTPHFSVFGAMSGFDSLEECFEDLSGEIFAIETGLSSDTIMNRRWSALDRLSLTSSSDAHSPSKLGREATILSGEVSYDGLVSALKRQTGPTSLIGTVEFFPEEGKYHVDGHRKCGFRCEPSEAARLGGVCPVCGKTLTPGVLGRVEQLADRSVAEIPPGFPGQLDFIPLAELISEIKGCGPASGKVQAAWTSMISRFGGELDILGYLEPEVLVAAGEYALAEALVRMRSARVFKDPGFDGEYGHIGVFLPGEAAQFEGQSLMFGTGERTPATPKLVTPKPERAEAEAESDLPLFVGSSTSAAADGLTADQTAAVACRERYIMVVAGPGTGKTRTLVARAADLVAEGVDPKRILVITFTNRAAGEAADRLEKKLGCDACPAVYTFHAFALRQLVDAAERHGIPPVRVVDSAAEKNGDASPVPSAEDAAWPQTVRLDDIVPLFSRLLESDRGAFSEFDHILVDEFQDISDDQYRMLDLLAGDRSSLFCVGDPDQSIYGFRGAVPGVFDRFAAEHEGVARHSICLTHRLTPQVTGVASAIMRGAAAGSGAMLQSAHTGGVPSVVCAGGHPRDEAAWVADTIARLLGGVGMLDSNAGVEGAGLGNIAVLGRTHQILDPVARALEEAGIPFERASDAPLWQHEWARVVIEAARASDRLQRFEDVARAALVNAGLNPPVKQLKTLLQLAGASECGPAVDRLTLYDEIDAFGLDPEKVHLLTMHAAKGLEFDHVFVVGCNEGTVPLSVAWRQDVDIEEERRLLFVAVTRAGKRLFLSWAASAGNGGPESRPGRVSRFLEHLEGSSIVAVEASRRPVRRPQQQSLF